jgi:hypothetical protein
MSLSSNAPRFPRGFFISITLLETIMSSRQQDRAPLCAFTFADGRRCRTPRSKGHPHFCFSHARKETQSHAAFKLGSDLSYFFSGDYVSACDLSTAIARLIPAVAQGHTKPKAASTIAYLSQTLVQTVQLAQHEYIETFGDEGWTDAVQISVNGNHDYRFPPPPSPRKQSEVHAPVPATQLDQLDEPNEAPEPARAAASES